MSPSPETVGGLLDELFLLTRAVRSRIARAGVDAHGLPQPLVGVLWALELSGPVRQNQLASSLAVSESVLSRQLSVLATDGSVERFRDEIDGRRSLVRVTETGRRKLASSMRTRADLLTPQLADWSEGDAQTILGALSRLRSSMAG